MNSIVEKYHKFIGCYDPLILYKYDTRLIYHTSFIIYIIYSVYGSKEVREFRKILTDEEMLFLSDLSDIEFLWMKYLLMSDEEYMVMDIIE